MDGGVDQSRTVVCFRPCIPSQFSRSCNLGIGCGEVWMGVAESAIHSLIRRAAGAYTAGPTVQDAQAVCNKLAREGVASTVCYWDVYSDQPASISQAYVGLLGA